MTDLEHEIAEAERQVRAVWSLEVEKMRHKLEVVVEMVKALEFILSPTGAYSRDKIVYLNNVIQEMQTIAQKALVKWQEVNK